MMLRMQMPRMNDGNSGSALVALIEMTESQMMIADAGTVVPNRAIK
jgi:hypothetical protein